jgi:hypothetical protein
LLTAPAVAALPVGLAAAIATHRPSIGAMVWLFSTVMLYLPTMVLGLPGLALLHGRVSLTALAGALGGVAVVALPVLGLIAAAPELRDGMFLHGMIGWPQWIAGSVVSGGLGGLTFWWIARPRRVVASAL